MTPAQRRYIVDQCPHSESRPSSHLCGPNTPLVVAFDNQPVRFSTGGEFAFTPGEPVASDLPTAATPWLALDRDHNGANCEGERATLIWRDGQGAIHAGSIVDVYLPQRKRVSAR